MYIMSIDYWKFNNDDREITNKSKLCTVRIKKDKLSECMNEYQQLVMNHDLVKNSTMRIICVQNTEEE